MPMAPPRRSIYFLLVPATEVAGYFLTRQGLSDLTVSFNNDQITINQVKPDQVLLYSSSIFRV